MKNTGTIVVFRKFKDGEIIALFPKLRADVAGKFCLSYLHQGQHGGADYQGVIDDTTKANPSEYYDLARELESIGYILNIRLGHKTPRG